MIGQLLLGLSLLVGLHEFGHFFFAKLFKIRVDKFYIFFDFLFPLPNVANFALFKKKVGGTEYGIGWFPLGGYVQIHGMVDETQDAEALAGPPQPDEFRAKPAWQRLLVMLGGIIMNVITGIVIFAALTFKYGEEYLPASEVRYGVVPNQLGKRIGFQTGDKVVKINGRPFQNFDEVTTSPETLLNPESYFTVERNGQLLDLKLPPRFMDLMADNGDSMFVQPRLPFTVKDVVSGTPAAAAGIKAGDKITQVGTLPVQFYHELQRNLARYKGQKVPVRVQRGPEQLTLQATVTKDGTLGVHPKFDLRFDTRSFSLGQSIPKGVEKAFGVVAMQAKALWQIVTLKASGANLGGPVEIAQQYGGQLDWLKFWSLTGMLSMVLALMNLLPVPALDGGHVVFLLYEMILRRKPSDAFMEGAQRVGTFLILSLMVYVIIIKQVLKLF